MRQERLERSSTLDPSTAEQEPGSFPSAEAGLCPSSNILAPPNSTQSSTVTSSPPLSTGRVSPPPMSTQSQSHACVTSDPSPAPQSSHETSTISPPSVQTSIPAAPGSQLSSNSMSVSSAVSVTPSGTGLVPASEPFSSPVTSSQPMSSSIHAPQHTTSQCQLVPISTQPPPPSSVPSQSQVQPPPVESEAAEPQTKTVGRDDIQALDKKLRSLFKDQSSASSSTSVDPSQNTGTSSPPAGTSSPPPGAAMLSPSNLPLNSGVQGVVGPTPAGHAQTPPSKPRAQVSATCTAASRNKSKILFIATYIFRFNFFII